MNDFVDEIILILKNHKSNKKLKLRFIQPPPHYRRPYFKSFEILEKRI